MTGNITPHLTWAEATNTSTGIPNIPNETEIENIKAVATKIFEPIRMKWGKPLKVGSLFRCEAVNTKIGGSKSSAHRFGLAIDITCPDKKENKALYEMIDKMIDDGELPIDQLIKEFPTNDIPVWIHCGLAKEKLTDAPRKQKLLAVKENGITKYVPLA